MLAAFFEKQQHTLTLPTASSVTYVLRFLEKLCHNLHCDPLFGSQPVARESLHYDRRTFITGTHHFGRGVGVFILHLTVK